MVLPIRHTSPTQRVASSRSQASPIIGAAPTELWQQTPWYRRTGPHGVLDNRASIAGRATVAHVVVGLWCAVLASDAVDLGTIPRCGGCQVVDALNFGGSLAAGAGALVGVGVAGAGVGATNALDNTIQAFVQGHSQVTATTGDVNITASDASDIDANAYVVSVGAAGALKGVAASGSVGIAVANNLLDNTVAAFVGTTAADSDGTTITASNLGLDATSTTAIEAQVVSTSVAVGAALVGVGVAVSGVVAENQQDNTLQAFVGPGSQLAIADDVTVTATDTSTLDATYGTGNLALGTVAGVAVGFATADNVTTNTVNAYIDAAEWLTTAGDVTIQATETAQLTTTNRITSGGLGIVGLTGAGVNSTTTVNTSTQAYATGPEEWHIDNLTIQAISYTTSHGQAHGGAGSAGLIGAAVGVSLVEVTDNSQAGAYFDLDGGAVLQAEDVIIEALATPKVTAEAQFIAIQAGSHSAAGVGTRARATLSPTVTAYVGDDTILEANSLTVQAQQAKPTDGSDAVAAIASAGAGALGVGAPFGNAIAIDITEADAYANSTVRAYIGDNAQIFTDQDVVVKALNTTQQFAGKTGVASGGIAFGSTIGISGGALLANTHNTQITEAYLGDTVALVANNLTLNALGSNDASVQGVTFGAAAGPLGLAVRAGESTTQNTSMTRAAIGTGSEAHRIRVFATVDVDAAYTHRFEKDLLVASAATTAAGTGAYAEHTVDSTVAVNFGENLQVEAGDIQVDALNTSQQLKQDDVSLRSAAGALLLSLALLESETNIAHQTTVNVGSGATLRQNSTATTDGIDFKARNVIDVQETVKAQSYGIVALEGLGEATIAVDSDANITLAAAATLDAIGDINLNSDSYTRARTVSEMETGGRLAGDAWQLKRA